MGRSWVKTGLFNAVHSRYRNISVMPLLIQCHCRSLPREMGTVRRRSPSHGFSEPSKSKRACDPSPWVLLGHISPQKTTPSEPSCLRQLPIRQKQINHSPVPTEKAWTSWQKETVSQGAKCLHLPSPVFQFLDQEVLKVVGDMT